MQRQVKLNSFEDLLAELEKIEKARELKTSGVWSVYQLLEHMSENLYGSLHGFSRHQPKIVRMTIGKFVLRKILKSGVMRSGYPNPHTPKTREEGDILSSIQKLRSIIEEFQNHRGNFAMHPIFDKLTKEQWMQLHLIHFSMHLSFLQIVDPDLMVDTLKNEEKNDPEPKPMESAPPTRTAPYTLSDSEIIIEDEDEEPAPLTEKTDEKTDQPVSNETENIGKLEKIHPEPEEISNRSPENTSKTKDKTSGSRIEQPVSKKKIEKKKSTSSVKTPGKQSSSPGISKKKVATKKKSPALPVSKKKAGTKKK